MKNHCDKCEWLLSEVTSKAVGLEHFCCLSPIREEIFGITEYFCGQWKANQEQIEKARVKAAEADAAHHRAMMETEMRMMEERDRHRRERSSPSPPTYNPWPLPKPVIPDPILAVMKVEAEEQKTLSLREKMKRRIKNVYW